jgi:hypothetical protein
MAAVVMNAAGAKIGCQLIVGDSETLIKIASRAMQTIIY